MKPTRQLAIALGCFLFLVLASPRSGFSEPKTTDLNQECHTLLYLYFSAANEVQMHENRKINNAERVLKIDNDADAHIAKLNGRISSIWMILQEKNCISLNGAINRKLEAEISAHEMQPSTE